MSYRPPVESGSPQVSDYAGPNLAIGMHPLGSGGRGRNRTIGARIFKYDGEPGSARQAEDRDGISAEPTEPPSPTEPIPNRTRRNRPNFSRRPCRSTSCGHRDRTSSEPRAERGRAGSGNPHPRPRSRSRGLSDNFTSATRSASNSRTIRTSAITPRSCHRSAKVPQRVSSSWIPYLTSTGDHRRPEAPGYLSESRRAANAASSLATKPSVASMRSTSARCRSMSAFTVAISAR